MSDESELEKLCKNILESSEAKRYAAQQVDFLEACKRYEEVRGELPLKFRIMKAYLYAKDTGDKRAMYMELGEHYDLQHGARMGYPAPVNQAIANHFRQVRKGNWFR
jgi:hypothetical protein